MKAKYRQQILKIIKHRKLEDFGGTYFCTIGSFFFFLNNKIKGTDDCPNRMISFQ